MLAIQIWLPMHVIISSLFSAPFSIFSLCHQTISALMLFLAFFSSTFFFFFFFLLLHVHPFYSMVMVELCL